MRPTRVTAALVLALFCALATHAKAGQSVKLNVALHPERLGVGTTIIFSFQISTAHGRVPPPLVGMDLQYPANIGLVTSGLGLTTCSTVTLEVLGPEGCPPNALMGYGSAQVEIEVGRQIIREPGSITTWMAPVKNGHLGLLFFALGQTPVRAELIFASEVLEAPPPFGGNLRTHIPIIPTWPDAPDAAVVQMRATIGPMHITYYRHEHGRRTPYHPTGLRLPDSCPSKGFPFAATFAFLDGSRIRSHASVPCPAAKRQR